MEQYDVVVVGAGLAGLEAARGLAERGASVLLVDRRSVVDEKVATTGIFVRRTLQDFDLPKDCLGPPVRDVILASPAGRELHLTSDQVEYRVGRMGRLYRRWLDGAVAAGAVWAPGTTFESAVPVPGGGLAVALQSADSPRRVEARFMIGADGSRSAVARALGLDVNRRELVGADHEARLDATGRIRGLQGDGETPARHGNGTLEGGARRPDGTGRDRPVQPPPVQPTHAPDPVLDLIAGEVQLAPGWRGEDDVAHRRTEAVLRQVEVLQRPADEDAGRRHLLVDDAPPIDEQHARAALGEPAGRLQAGQARADHDDVVLLHALTVVPARAAPSSHRPGQEGDAGVDQVRSKRSRFMTLSHAFTKSRTNLSLASSAP